VEAFNKLPIEKTCVIAGTAVFYTTAINTQSGLSRVIYIYIYIFFFCILKVTYSVLFLRLWFRTSLIYIKNCPTRCNTKQSIYYYASSLYMFWVSTTPIIMSTQNCKYSLRYWSYFLCSYPPTWLSTKNTTSTGGCSYSFSYS